MRRFCTYWHIPALIACMGMQGAFWHHTRDRLPEMGVVPNPPGREALGALSFGDPEFLFRVMAFSLGNAGDTFGRFTSLKEYDLRKVRDWFVLLDGLDDRSDLLPGMAAYYYSQTQNQEQVRYLVEYIYAHSAHRPSQKWWWLVQGLYLAMHRLHDDDLALKLAMPLTQAKDIPVWAQQMPAFVHEKRGEMDDALVIIENILDDVDEIPDKELRFMKYFVDNRLERMDKLSKDAEERLQEEREPEGENP